MTSIKKTNLLLVGSDSMLDYLLRRFAERSGFRVLATQEAILASEINTPSLVGVVFLSIELLEKSQPMIEELANHDTPILVCSSVAEEARALELGADFCLFHPLTYDDFFSALSTASLPGPINPV